MIFGTLLDTLGTTTMSSLTSTSLDATDDTLCEEPRVAIATLTTSAISTTTSSSSVLGNSNSMELELTRNYMEALTIEEQEEFVNLVAQKLAQIGENTDLEFQTTTMESKSYVKKL